MNWSAISYSLCVAFFLVHELDAIYRNEWRLLPLLRALPDDRGFAVFTALHLPVFVALLLSVSRYETFPASAFRGGLCAFAVVHVGIHFFWPRTELYTFDNLFSRFWIYGAGGFGAVYLLLP